MERDSMIRYGSWDEAIDNLPEEKQQFYSLKFIRGYGLRGTKPDPSLDAVAYSMFLMAKPQIDANNKRYAVGKRGGQYGNLGGAPEGNTNAVKNWDKVGKQPHRGGINNPTGVVETTPNVNVNVNENENANGNVNEKENVKEKKTNQKKEEEEVIKNKKIKQKVVYSDLFESFWKAYPKKKGKQKAREAWENAIKGGNDPKLLITKAGEYATEIKLKRVEDKFIKFAQGWLNEGRYDDDYFTGNNGIKPNLDDLY